MKIVTTYTSNASGKSQIVAKCNGKQKTIGYMPGYSSMKNHGLAAAAMVEKMSAADAAERAPFNIGMTVTEAVVSALDSDSARHETNNAGTVHTFWL